MRHLTTFLLVSASLAALFGAASKPVIIDPLDETTGFFQLSPTALVEAEPGKAVLTKTEPASDAFARWGRPHHNAIPFKAGADRVEIAIAELRGGAMLQVRVQFVDDAGGDLGHVPWTEAHDMPGTIALESLVDHAEKHGKSEAAAFRLLFRHMGQPGGAIVLDEIRVMSSAN